MSVSVVEERMARWCDSQSSETAESLHVLHRVGVPSRERVLVSGRLHLRVVPADPERPVLIEGLAGITTSTREPAPGGASGARLREALRGVGLDAETAEGWARAAQAHGALVQRSWAAPGPGGDPGGEPAVTGPAGGTSGLDGVEGADEVGCAGLTRAAVPVLDGIGDLAELGARLDAAVLGLARELTARHGQILLAGKGATDPGELSAGQREKWRARAKSLTRAEIEALTGWGAGEVADLVGLVNAPRAVSAVVAEGMRAGVAPWRLARRFWRECSGMAHEDAAVVAHTLFGSEAATVAPERLTPSGELAEGPWRHREFYRALEREVAQIAGRDPAARREQRQQAHARREVRATIGEDGTGALVITGSAVQAAAVMDRLEAAARRARKHGDPRTLAQLRADIALSLLLHATLALPDLPEDPDLVTVEHADALAAVLNALPAATLQVIVPYSVFHQGSTGGSPSPSGPARPAAAGSAFWPDSPPTAQPWPWTWPPGSTCPTCGTSPTPGSSPPGGAAKPDPAAPAGTVLETLAVGQVQGAFPTFLTPDEVRDLALIPGTTLHRLLVDPATGRCVERSTQAYRPDAAMRVQILAADVTCRAPGACEPDRSPSSTTCTSSMPAARPASSTCNCCTILTTS